MPVTRKKLVILENSSSIAHLQRCIFPKQLVRILYMPKNMKEKLWERQGGRCYFCNKRLHCNEANTDHLQPKSRGGGNGINNRVLCCILINRWFADMPYYEKMALTRKWRKEQKERKICFYKAATSTR